LTFFTHEELFAAEALFAREHILVRELFAREHILVRELFAAKSASAAKKVKKTGKKRIRQIALRRYYASFYCLPIPFSSLLSAGSILGQKIINKQYIFS
jgi:hypothetical protein